MIVSQNDYERKADDSDGEGKNRPEATNFQLLKILAPFGTASCWGVPASNPAGNEYGKLEVVSFFTIISLKLVLLSH